MDVRREGLWTYVLRVLGRTSIEPLNGGEQIMNALASTALFLNGF